MKILGEKETQFDDCTIHHLTLSGIATEKIYVGIDPGTVNLGICFIRPIYTEILQVKLTRQDDPIKRMVSVQYLIHRVTEYQHESFAAVVIEGASFGDKYRQVELAEQRAAVALLFFRRSFIVRIIPPISIRKAIFGSTKIKATEFWTDLHHVPDGAAALSCALYAHALSCALYVQTL